MFLTSASYNTISGDISFVDNTGVAMLLPNGSHNSISGNISFVNNIGSAILLPYSSHNDISGNILFANNTGSAILLPYGSHNNISGNILSVNNTGSAILLPYGSHNNISGNILFVNNTESGISLPNSNNNGISGNILFVNNIGSGISIPSSNNNSIFGNISFINNSAENAMSLIGGSHHSIYGNIVFVNNTCSGVAMLLNGCTHYSISGNILFVNNSGGTMSLIGGSHNDISGNISFVNNTGSAMLLNDCSYNNISGNISFVNNNGDAMSLSGVSHNNISGNILFNATVGDAMMLTYSTNNTISGKISFVKNTRSAVTLIYSVHDTFVGNISFVSNTATLGGAIRAQSMRFCNISGNISIINNTATQGGAMYLYNAAVHISGNISFVDNIATLGVSNPYKPEGGGAIYSYLSTLLFSGSAMFLRNQVIAPQGSGIASGGATSTYHTTLTFETCKRFNDIFLFTENSATFEGGAISMLRSGLTLQGGALFEGNVASYGGAITLRNSHLLLSTSQYVNTTFTFHGSMVNAISGGAIYVVDGSVNMTGTLYFLLNSAQQGGAMTFSGSSRLILTEPLRANFIENQATAVGGAIFFADAVSISQCTGSSNQEDCFIELNSTSNIYINFVNNTAGIAGRLLYGGSLDSCRLFIGGGYVGSCGNRTGGQYSDNPINTLKNISNIVSDDSLTSDISSDPLQVCFCEGDSLECKDYKRAIVTGREFTLHAVIVGQNKGIVPSSVRTSLSNSVEINVTQRTQSTGKECTPITYRLFSNSSTTNLTLFPDNGPCRDIGISRREINIEFLPCPDGFTLSGLECVCEDRLQRYTTNCNVDDSSVERSSNTFWMGAVYNNETYEGLILHSGCPFDNCVDTPVSIKLDILDIQCNHNHSGTLCGSCKSNYSITFGTLHSLPCSNHYLALILPFALAGVALVAALLLLQLSVANGTVNGLIFYANVIQTNRSSFFSPGETNVLTVFIAWLNLDLGIETCFYDGRNAYALTWLQFLFPFYVWFLIGLIIVVSHRSQIITSILGNNPVATLATLLLLSYSKILHTIIIALSFTRLEYPDGTHKLVWLYDGNVPYFQRADHIALGVFAAITLLSLFLPYTFFLLCGHWLRG